MDLPFILQNYTGLVVARCIERMPGLLYRLRRSRSRLKPFIATRLRGERLPQRTIEDLGPFKMHLRLRDDVQRQIFLGLYEKHEIQMCRALVRSGGTCIDVGANVGWFSLHFAVWVGASGRVVACEADPAIASELRENCALNSLQNIVEILNTAVADAAGTVRFTRSSPEHSGWGSVLPQEGNRGGEGIDVPAITLDSIIASRRIDEVDLLKVDVEGYEFEVLRGAADALRRRIFRNVLIEWAGAGQTGHHKTIDEMHAIFDSNGYEPDQSTACLLNDVRSGKKDARRTFANLMYHRIATLGNHS